MVSFHVEKEAKSRWEAKRGMQKYTLQAKNAGTWHMVKRRECMAYTHPTTC